MRKSIINSLIWNGKNLYFLINANLSDRSMIIVILSRYYIPKIIWKSYETIHPHITFYYYRKIYINNKVFYLLQFYRFFMTP